MSESSLAIPEGAQVSALMGQQLFNPDLDFKKLALEATYFSQGFKLVEKDALEGVPHIIIGVTYRPGFTDKAKVQYDYVSVEAVVADADTLRMPQFGLNPAELTVFPNQAVVYNDGGTGIRRQLTELFQHAGLIDCGGEADRPMSQWKSGDDIASAGIQVLPTGEKFRYVALNGLRKSEYENEYGEATTWYLA